MVEVYEKKISKDEAEYGFILIEKDKMRIFPESGKRFIIYYNENKFEVDIDEIPSEGMLLDKPHKYYHLHIPVQIRKGDTAVITKDGKDYKLELKR